MTTPHPPSTALLEQTYNLMPLEEWRYAMAFNPWHFWQLANEHVPITSTCNSIVRQYAWQNAQAGGRNEIREAIISAEERLRLFLGYSVAPHYRVETHAWPKYRDDRFSQSGYAAADERWKTIQLDEGYIQAVGVETLEEIKANAVIAFSDVDGDGLMDQFMVTAPTLVTDPEEIAVYFSATERPAGVGVSSSYRLEPVRVAISGGNVTITGNAWLCAKPVQYQGASTDPLDPNAAGTYATTLDIYHRFTSAAGNSFDTSQAVLIWETRPWPYWAIFPIDPTGTQTDPAGMAFALARCGIRDAVNGIVTVGETTYDPVAGTWNLTDWEGCRPPDRVLIRYQAGSPLEYGRMNATFRPVVARMAAAELARPICACDNANRELYQWQYDLSRTGGSNDEQYATSSSILNNPFGMRRGHVYAYRSVEFLRVDRGMVA